MKILLFCLMLCGVASAQSVAFKLQKGYLMVVKCSASNIRGLTAILDTGATETAIDTKLAKRLGLKMSIDIATFGTREASVMSVSIPNVSLGPLHADTLSGIGMDMSIAERSFGVHPDLILGTDFLQRHSFLIDYKARSITFASPPHLTHTAQLISVERMLLVSASMGARKLTLQVDTGFNGLLIYGGAVHDPATDINSQNESAVGGNPIHLASIPLKLGDWSGNQITVAVTDDEPRNPAPFDGLLGPKAITASQFAVDFENHAIYWK
jgi:predicted aspartyl protease